MMRFLAVLGLAAVAGGAKNRRHDVELYEFIRNASKSDRAPAMRPDTGRRDSSQRIAVQRDRAPSDDDDEAAPVATAGQNSAGPVVVPSTVGEMTPGAMRHADLTEWKKMKREKRLAHKATGLPKVKVLGQAGTTAKEYLALEVETGRGGRMVRAPCTPPHCTFRCHTDKPCKTHPLMSKWLPPQPRMCGARRIHPMSFGIPESDIVECVPFKTADFASVVPYRDKSYAFGPADEAEYKRDYRKAMFGITRKKEGWDCMRHYEILAAGTVPMFIDIAKAPDGVMTHLPKALLTHVREMRAFWVKGCEMRHSL
jgi:hypothetical protein